VYYHRNPIFFAKSQGQQRRAGNKIKLGDGSIKVEVAACKEYKSEPEFRRKKMRKVSKKKTVRKSRERKLGKSRNPHTKWQTGNNNKHGQQEQLRWQIDT